MSGPVPIRVARGRRRRGDRPWILVVEVDGVAYASEYATRLEALIARTLAHDVVPRVIPGSTVRAELPVRRAK